MTTVRARRGAKARESGRAAEVFCALWLMAKGYRLLGFRLRTPAGEIDLLAVKGGVVAVVEVKRRTTIEAALEAVSWRQRQRPPPSGGLRSGAASFFSVRAGAARPYRSRPRSVAASYSRCLARRTAPLACKDPMPLQVAIQMDSRGINIATDTTFMLMMEAQARGHTLWVYPPERLAMEDGQVSARGRTLSLRDKVGDHATYGAPEKRALADFDVVLMRQDPPFDMAYVTATHLLETIHPRTLVVNDPAEVRNAPEKLFVTGFPGLQPPTLITSDPDAIDDFRARHGDMVLKPLYGGGGSGVVRLRVDDPNLDALLELHAMISREPVIAQKFIPAVAGGGQADFTGRRRTCRCDQPHPRRWSGPLQPRQGRPSGGG